MPRPTREILRRVYELTTSHFALTIVDNDSDPDYRDALATAMIGHENASLILLDRNAHWGPAMNVALEGGRSEFAIYVCSKEGFVLKPGWEREYIETLKRSREVAMAGHRISSPAFLDGRAYTTQPWFGGFRNKEFAESNPDRVFAHVQGGLFGLRRSAYERAGGFSTLVAQDAVDVEFSYLLESLGWKLESVPAVPSVTKKTRPRVSAHLDEHTVAAHPLTIESAEDAGRVVLGQAAFCNVCAWNGTSFESNGAGREICPGCGSTPLGRLVYRWVAGTSLPYRSLRCVALIDDEALRIELGSMFTLETVSATKPEALADPGNDLVIADLALASSAEAADLAEFVGQGVKSGATAILGSSDPGGAEDLSAAAAALSAAGVEAGGVVVPSRAVGFPRSGLVVARRPHREKARQA